MFTTLQEYYIDRNVKILKGFAEWRDKGKKHRDILPLISTELEVSKGLVNSVCHDPEYSYAKEAKEKIKEELAEMESEGKEISPALAKLVSYEPQNTTTVPN